MRSVTVASNESLHCCGLSIIIIIIIIHLSLDAVKRVAVYTHDRTNEFSHVIDLGFGAKVIAKPNIPHIPKQPILTIDNNNNHNNNNVMLTTIVVYCSVWNGDYQFPVAGIASFQIPLNLSGFLFKFHHF